MSDGKPASRSRRSAGESCASRSRPDRRTSRGTDGPRSRLRRILGAPSDADAGSSDATRASSSRTRASSCSMRSAAASPTDAVAQPSARICSARWFTAKNTALRTTVFAALTPRLRESTGADACDVGLLLEQRDRGSDVAGRRRSATRSARLSFAPGSRYADGKSERSAVWRAAASISARTSPWGRGSGTRSFTTA